MQRDEPDANWIPLTQSKPNNTRTLLHSSSFCSREESESANPNLNTHWNRNLSSQVSTCSHARHTHKRCLENQKTTQKFQNTSREETTGGATTSCQVASCIMQRQQQPQLGGMPCLASAMIMMIVIHWVNSLVNGQRMHISNRREGRRRSEGAENSEESPLSEFVY